MSLRSSWIPATFLHLALTGAAFGGEARNVKTGAPIDGPRRSGIDGTITGAPLSYEKEMSGRLDIAVAKGFGIGVEGNVKADREEADGDAISDEESRRAQGMGGAILFTAYSGHRPLTGFFGAVGAGYRKESVKWQVAPDAKDADMDLTLVKSDQKMHHAASLKGPTGHARAGYRIAVPATPLVLGGFVGARYFQASVADATGDDLEDSTPMTSGEKARLAKDYQAKVEAAVELGFAF